MLNQAGHHLSLSEEVDLSWLMCNSEEDVSLSCGHMHSSNTYPYLDGQQVSYVTHPLLSNSGLMKRHTLYSHPFISSSNKHVRQQLPSSPQPAVRRLCDCACPKLSNAVHSWSVSVRKCKWNILQSSSVGATCSSKTWRASIPPLDGSIWLGSAKEQGNAEEEITSMNWLIITPRRPDPAQVSWQ